MLAPSPLPPSGPSFFGQAPLDDGPQTQAALATASPPGPMLPGGSPTRIEIDVARQVLFHWVNGELARI